MATLEDFLKEAKNSAQSKYTSAMGHILHGTNLAVLHKLNPDTANGEDVERVMASVQDPTGGIRITDPKSFQAGQKELAESINEYPLDFRRYLMMGHLFLLDSLTEGYKNLSAPIPPGPSVFKVKINLEAFHKKAEALKGRSEDSDRPLEELELKFVLDHIHKEQKETFAGEPAFLQRLVYASLRQKENLRKVEDFERGKSQKNELLKVSEDRPAVDSFERMFDNFVQALSYYLIAVKCDPDYHSRYEGGKRKALIGSSFDKFEEWMQRLNDQNFNLNYNFLRANDDYEVEPSKVSLDKVFFLTDKDGSLHLDRGNIIYLIDNQISVILDRLDQHLGLRLEQAVGGDSLEMKEDEYFDNYVRQSFLEGYVSTSQGSIYALRRLGDLILHRAEVGETDRILLESIEELDSDSVRQLFTKYGIELGEDEDHWEKLDEAKNEAKKGKKRLIDKLKEINDHYMQLQGNCKNFLDAVIVYLRNAVKDSSYNFDAVLEVLNERGYRPEPDRLVESFGESYFIKDENLKKIFTLTQSIWATGTASLRNYHETVKNIIDLQSKEGGWLSDTVGAANNAAGTWRDNYTRSSEELLGYFHKGLAKRAFIAPELVDFVKRRRVWEGRKGRGDRTVSGDMEGAMKRLGQMVGGR